MSRTFPFVIRPPALHIALLVCMLAACREEAERGGTNEESESAERQPSESDEASVEDAARSTDPGRMDARASATRPDASGPGLDAGVPAAGRDAGRAPAADTGVAPRDAAAPVDAAPRPSQELGEEQTLVPDPSWTCGLAEGIPPPQLGREVFVATLELGTVHDVGETPYGKRTLIEVRGGSFEGPRIRGSFLERGLDWQLELGSGAVEIEGVNILRTSAGANIYTRICGASPAGTASARVVFDFEAPNGSEAAFLNQGTYVGLREFEAGNKKLVYRVFDLAGVAPPPEKVQMVEPEDVPDQSYDCQSNQGTRGAVVYMASVSIGAGSVSVGASKRGSRNIIPITGGSVSGKLMGTVLNGGADYQLNRNGTLSLDARYTLRMADGTLVLVRNCGPASALVPVYETKKGTMYEWINKGPWLSSSPQISIGAVNLTTYETRP